MLALPDLQKKTFSGLLKNIFRVNIGMDPMLALPGLQKNIFSGQIRHGSNVGIVCYREKGFFRAH